MRNLQFFFVNVNVPSSKNFPEECSKIKKFFVLHQMSIHMYLASGSPDDIFESAVCWFFFASLGYSFMA